MCIVQEAILGRHKCTGSPVPEHVTKPGGGKAVFEFMFSRAESPACSEPEYGPATGESQRNEEVIPLLFITGFESENQRSACGIAGCIHS